MSDEDDDEDGDGDERWAMSDKHWVPWKGKEEDEHDNLQGKEDELSPGPISLSKSDKSLH